MGGPIGNKHALGHGHGRPGRDLVALTEELIKWAKKDDSINLCAFCADNNLPPEKISVYSDQDNDFRQAAQLAKATLGARREAMLNAGRLHSRAYDLNANVYDYFMDEKQEKRIKYVATTNAKAAADEAAAVNPAILAAQALVNSKTNKDISE